MPDRAYTAAEVDAAIAGLLEPERLRHAEEVVTHAAPALQRVLTEALRQGGWFGSAHDAEVARAADEPDAGERTRAVSTLVAEQTRLGMFVGVAVGFELAHELQHARNPANPAAQPDAGDPRREGEHADTQHPPAAAHPTRYGLPIHISPPKKDKKPEREAE